MYVGIWGSLHTNVRFEYVLKFEFLFWSLVRGIFFRKQCEVTPTAIQSLLEASLAILVNVPFAKCVCVDARNTGHVFSTYVIENCYFFAPGTMRTMLFAFVQAAEEDSSKIEAICSMLVEYAATSVKDSMIPVFSKQFDATQYIGSSVDYLMNFIESDGGKCMDFTQNPYTIVLMPEPVDYFAACGSTTLCATKCYSEMNAFEIEVDSYAHASKGSSRTITSTRESLIFVNGDQDSLTPMKIITIVQLSDCSKICGGTITTGVNADSCIAIAGFSTNKTISIMKYCIPTKLSMGVRNQVSENWDVWYSEDWSHNVQDLQFTDTHTGDCIVAYRDNHAKDVKDGPRTQFISLHPRSIQLDTDVFLRDYGTNEFRNERLLVVSTDTLNNDFAGKLGIVKFLGIINMLVIPSFDNDNEDPFIFLQTTYQPSDPTFFNAGKMVMCGALPIAQMIENKGLSQQAVEFCKDINELFTVMTKDGFIPVIFARTDENQVAIAFVPTTKGPQLFVATIQFNVGHVGFKTVPYKTPDDFSSNYKLPVQSIFLDMAKESMRTGDTPVRSTTGTIILSRKRMAQNTLTVYDAKNDIILPVFISNDPDSPTDWLNQIRIFINTASVSLDIFASQKVEIKTTLLQTCDKRSCLGCPPHIQAVCYTMQNCMVTKCIGTVVNLNKPLCNIGMSVQSGMDTSIAGVLGVWLLFAESYSVVLQLSLDTTTRFKNLEIESVDDSFMGVMCTAKNALGQSVSIFTSAVGRKLIASHRDTSMQNGGRQIDTAKSAKDGFILAGFNTLFYQLSLLPLYLMIASQKTFVCTANSVLAVFSKEDSFSITLGRSDLQKASDVTSGQCLTAAYDSALEDSEQEKVQDNLADSTFVIMQGAAKNLETLRLGTTANALIKKFTGTISKLTIRVPIQLFDSVITYAMGVVSGMQSLTQALDDVNCRIPNYYIYKTTSCACDDDAVAISDVRKNEGLEQHAHWCSGTLKMTNAFGKILYVYNQFTYADLQSKLSGMDAYLKCISKLAQGTTTNSVNPPACNKIPSYKIQEFEDQGVSAIAVLQKCKANYHQKKWDDGAFMLYDKVLVAKMPTNSFIKVKEPIFPVEQCLLDAESNGNSNLGCLQDFIKTSGVSYWKYDRRPDLVGSQFVDACIVFTGPSKDGTTVKSGTTVKYIPRKTEVVETFKKCVQVNLVGCML